ncbi:MAG: hypothetical protein DRR19_26165 [Candidatus Parabeggiatoa sp. nov. 1]|nr:MAG: hypothetical protein DRR19_26165 [Gammaproteobacteria bacterium]
MRRRLTLMSCLSLLLIATSIYARPKDGSCINYDFSQLMDKHRVIDTNQPVRVLRHNAPVYRRAGSRKSKAKFKFGEALLPVRVNRPHKRIQVRKWGGKPLGWMNKYDLLCGVTPLPSKNGLDRKVFINTPDSKDPKMATVPAYSSYKGLCNGRCKQLSRFRLYFIFAEDKKNKRYLVIDTHTLAGMSSPPRLVGWVEYGRTIPWNTTLGMRPREEVDRISLIPQDSKGKQPQTGIELMGGNIWYTLPKHIPILDLDKGKQLYHVAAPSIGMQQPFKQYQNVLDSMKLVDVFFLIDGTASMGPHISAVRQAVKNITGKLRNEPDFKETSFRFGFRVYRDTYADAISGLRCRNGICEGMPLSTKTCQADNDATEANWQAFVKKMGQVKETRDDKGKDDYPEKLFGGLRQAIQDMTPCPNRTKILFVIGDHGDRQSKVPQDIVDGLNYSFDRKVVFFIQTPNNSRQARTPSAYRMAYIGYGTQATKLLKKTLPAEFEGKKITIRKYFLSLNQTQLPTRVVEQVKQYSPSAIVNELEQALAGGDSLRNVLRKSMKAGGMPVLYWKWIEETACAKLGKQCETRVDHRVIDFYIPTNKKKVQEEVWMTADNLDDWLTLLKPFKNLVGNTQIRQQREAFIRLLRRQIQEIIGGYPREDITLAEQLAMVRKNALPMREDSPLLQYTIKEIREEIEGCELLRLVEWVSSIRKVLQRVFNDSTQKVVFSLEYPTKSASCPLSDKGKKVPKLNFGLPAALGPNDNYRYDHTFYNQIVYWLPVDFLP